MVNLVLVTTDVKYVIQETEYTFMTLRQVKEFSVHTGTDGGTEKYQSCIDFTVQSFNSQPTIKLREIWISPNPLAAFQTFMKVPDSFLSDSQCKTPM